MKRALGLALASLFLLAVPANAAVDYRTLAAEATVVSRTDTSVTIFMQQTAGETVKLNVVHQCWNDTYNVTVTDQKATVTGSATMTFSTAPTRKGIAPEYCQFMVKYQMPSQTVAILVHIFTLP